MTTIVDDVLQEADESAAGTGLGDGFPVRRGFLGILGRLGLGVVGAAAAMTATSQPASAGLSSPCCHLASNRQCSGSCHYKCPSGYHAAYWGCISGVRPIWCGECQSSGGSNCWAGGKYYCSVWWDDAYCTR